MQINCNRKFAKVKIKIDGNFRINTPLVIVLDGMEWARRDKVYQIASYVGKCDSFSFPYDFDLKFKFYEFESIKITIQKCFH